MRIKYKFSFAIFIIGFLFIGAASIFHYFYFKKAEIKSEFEKIRDDASKAADNINNILIEKSQIAITLGHDTAIREALLKSNATFGKMAENARKENISRLNTLWMKTNDTNDLLLQTYLRNPVAIFLKEHQARFPKEYGEIFLTNKFGALVASTAKLTTFSHGHKSWWQGAYHNGLGSIFFDDRGYDDSVGGYVLGVVVPVKNEGEIIGILKCNLNILGSISQIFDSSFQPHKSGSLKLARSGGKVVYETGKKPLSTELSAPVRSVLKHKKKGSVLLIKNEPKRFVGFSPIQITVNLEGYRFGGSFASIDHKEGNLNEYWTIIKTEPQEAALSTIIHASKILFIIGLGLTLLLAALSLYLGRRLAIPIHMLVQKTNAVGDGRFDERIKIQSNDELAKLAKSFNTMANNLEKTTTSRDALLKEIQEKNKVKKELICIERRNQALLDHSPVCHKIVDLDFNLQYMSANGFKMLKIDENAKVYGNPYPFSFFPSKFQKKMIRNLKKVKATGEKRTMEALTNDIEGNNIWLESALIPVFDDNGTIEYLTVVSADTTWRKKEEDARHRLESQLHQSRKLEAIGNLAGGIAHDFNNILSSIIGFTQLALDQVEKNTDLEDDLQEVFNAGKRAKNLVNQILAFSRKSEEKIKPLQPSIIVKEVLKLIRSSIPTSIEIRQDIHNDSFIMGNPTQLHQIIMNLCTNAAQAMEDHGGFLGISIKDISIGSASQKETIDLKPGDYVRIQVSDTGTGIPEEIINSIFEPYFTTKGAGEGTGMGLSVVHGIVQTYGGKITLDSTPGRGSTFTIYFPMTNTHRQNHIDTSENLPTGSEKILYVDDEAPIAKMGKRTLEQLGYSVETKTDSLDALEVFRSGPNDFDLVITDMTMPNMTGDVLASELTSIRPDIPVILCTGFSKKVSDKSIQEIGIKAFVNKPLVKAVLAKTIRKILDDAKG